MRKAVVKYLFEMNRESASCKTQGYRRKGRTYRNPCRPGAGRFLSPNNPKPVSRADFKNLYLEST